MTIQRRNEETKKQVQPRGSCHAKSGQVRLQLSPSHANRFKFEIQWQALKIKIKFSSILKEDLKKYNWKHKGQELRKCNH